MKILFFGDSITDMNRNRANPTSDNVFSYGSGYPIFIASELYKNNPNDYEIINRGISGNRIVDLYARVKSDVWDENPDVLSILIGINDVWHEVCGNNGVDLERFEKVYRMLIEDTLKVLPNVKIILCEPFVLKGSATENTEEIPNKYNKFLEVYEYAKVVKKIAQDFNLSFVALQDEFNKKSQKYGVEPYLFDGVHPMIAGAKLIADEWLKVFNQYIEK